MRVRFWGTRGSIAAAGPETVRYGGNTACVEVRSAAGGIFVLDSGTGARKLGHALAELGPVRVHLLIGHTHADHIQGLPFFLPAFTAGSHLTIYGPTGVDRDFPSAIGGQMDYAYFPVPLRDLPATIQFVELDEGEFVVEGVRIVAQHLNHTAPCLGYRLEAGGATFVYATDHEPFAVASTGLGHPGDRRHVAFLSGADLVVHDAQYTEEEYATKVGWGHSTAEYAVAVSLAAGAKRLALFHHDPARDDRALDAIVAAAGDMTGGVLEVLGAAEGLTLELPERTSRPTRSLAPPSPRVPSRARVLVADDDEGTQQLLRLALNEDGYDVTSVRDGEAAVAAARGGRFDLVVLDIVMPQLNGFAVCRALRALPEMGDTPILMVTALDDPAYIAAAFVAGATDYLTKPFSVAQLRARIRTWLARTAARP